MKDRLLKSSDKLYSRHFIHINRSTRGINVWSSTLRFLVCGMAYALLEPSFISEQYGELTGQEIGVITPYPSQIARITKEIRDMGLPVDRTE